MSGLIVWAGRGVACVFLFLFERHVLTTMYKNPEKWMLFLFPLITLFVILGGIATFWLGGVVWSLVMR